MAELRFPYKLIHDFPDVTRNFEALEARNILDSTQTSFLQLLAAQNLQLAFGNGNANFVTGLLSTGAITVAHGLGRVPKAYVAFMDQRASTNTTYTLQTQSAADATNLNLYGVATVAPGANFGLNFYWLAVG